MMGYPHLERDDENNVAYLYLRAIKAGESKRQIPIAWKIQREPQLILDLSATGEVLGIEFLDAREQLWKEGGAPDAS